MSKARRLSTRLANRVLPNAWKKQLKFARARLFEAIGSKRYSRPALYGMDRRLDHLLDRDGGVFVECGANDGYTQSNTYYLARFRGWTGFLIEPVPQLFELCRRFRPESQVINCALGPADGGTVEILYGDLRSTTVGAQGSPEDDLAHVQRGARFVRREGHYLVKAPVRSLTALLTDAGAHKVDLLVLDVEGFELNVLKGVDFDAVPIEAILVETAEPDAVQALLDPHYRLVGRFSHHDYFFERRAELAAA